MRQDGEPWFAPAVAHGEEGDLLVMLSVFRITSQGTFYIGSGLNTDREEIGLVMPRAYTIRGIGVSSGAVAPSPGSYAYTLFKNADATAIAGALSGATKIGVFTGTVAGVAGDKITCRVIIAGDAPDAYHTVVLDVDWSS